MDGTVASRYGICLQSMWCRAAAGGLGDRLETRHRKTKNAGVTKCYTEHRNGRMIWRVNWRGLYSSGLR